MKIQLENQKDINHQKIIVKILVKEKWKKKKSLATQIRNQNEVTRSNKEEMKIKHFIHLIWIQIPDSKV